MQQHILEQPESLVQGIGAVAGSLALIVGLERATEVGEQLRLQ
jgi:hypothetical protein